MRKMRRFNGEDDSYVEGTATSLRDDTEDQLRQNQSDRMARMARGEMATDPESTQGKALAELMSAKTESSAPAAAEPAAAKSEGFGSAFAKARAKFLDGGPSTFVWDGKRYGTDLKTPNASNKSVGSGSTPKAFDKEQQYQRAQEAAQTPEGKAKRSAMEKSQALENFSPELEIAGGLGSLGVKAVAKLVKNLAGQRSKEVAKRVEPKFREKELEILKDIPRSLPGPKKQLALPAPPKRLEYNQVGAKRGGAIKTYASGGSVSASRRGDGIAQRGKTRGKMC